ncbi:MAG: SIS domain-containing protein [Alphaproteobacteria bacterium]|nr:MAG: SIS domain-containing protein [Alphaproteobacteria bacterium]
MERLQAAAATVDRAAFERAAVVLLETFARGGILYVCGNGGSAAISNHMTCDIMKGVRSDTDLTPRIVSLSSNIEIITAIANDIAYADVFAYQLKAMVKPVDALMTISSSGNSDNIVRVIEVAKEAGIPTIAMTGFDGGRSATMADINLHVAGDNYGIIEDVHQSLMHVLAQYMRMSGMPVDLICDRKF